MDVITSIDELEALYGDPVRSSIAKVSPVITSLQREYIAAAPFVVIATVGSNGVDCSPRGDPAGFVRVVDGRTVQIPDRRGNNRLDSLRNIVVDGRIALLFLVPGIGVTLRINGHAVLRTDPDLRASFEHAGKLPATVIEVAVSECYTQCPKALIRSDLWNADHHRTPDELPSVGSIMDEILGTDDGATYGAAYPQRVKETLY